MSSIFIKIEFIIILQLQFQATFCGYLKWTGAECEVFKTGADICSFDYCYIKAIRRNYAELSIKMNLHHRPLSNITMKIQLWKLLNGYRPFLYNIEYDLCKFFKAGKYRLSLEKYIFQIVRDYTNLNLSCPWITPSIIVDKFGLTDKMFQLPIPSGSYRFDFSFAYKGIYRSITRLKMAKEE